jgi:hypothetical protein
MKLAIMEEWGASKMCLAEVATRQEFTIAEVCATSETSVSEENGTKTRILWFTTAKIRE